MAGAISTRASSFAPMRVVAPSSTTRRLLPARCNFLRLLHHPHHRRLSHSASSGTATARAPREVPEATAEEGEDMAVVVVQDDKVKVHDYHTAASAEHKAEGKRRAGVGGPKPPDGRCEGIGGRGGIIHAAPPPAAVLPSSSG